MVQNSAGDDNGGPSSAISLINQRSDSENITETSKTIGLRVDTTVFPDLLSPTSQTADQEGEISASRPRTPSIIICQPDEDDPLEGLPQRSASNGDRDNFYQQKSGSENSFASIETVNDLGFNRQAEASNTAGKGSGSLHPRKARMDHSTSNASLVHSGDEIGEISAQKWLAKRLRASSCPSKASDVNFMPICEIEKILSREAVQEVLKQEIGRLSGVEATAELEKLTQDICGVPSRRRLFALLLLGERAECIPCFVECDIDDTDLPFSAASNTSELPDVYPRSNGKVQGRLKCVKNWKTSEVEWLLDRQHVVASPFFDLAPGNLFLYTLPNDTILPFIESEVAGEGGYANIWKVLIHPAHHNFQSPAGTEEQYFAVKTLHTKNRIEYKREVEVLQRFSGRNKGHPHLIRLLLTYQHKGSYHMIFPWANGNLRDLWESDQSPERTQALVCWMLSQYHGISDGLREIHGNNNELNPTEKNKGRHGDIKAENILWIENHNDCKNHLLICDFGLSRFHSFKSQTEDKVSGCSPSYRPPECDLYRLRISVNYDIWTLGCLLLDFLTWYLLGWNAVDTTFSDARMVDEGWTSGAPKPRHEKTNNKWLYEDKFFKQHSDGNIVSAQLKPSVIIWMEKLHRLDHCPEFAHDILEIIHKGLLHPDKRKRWDCSKIVAKLDTIHQKCVSSEAYCLRPHKWEGEPLEHFNVSYRMGQIEQLERDQVISFSSATAGTQQAGHHTPGSLSPVSGNCSRASTPPPESQPSEFPSSGHLEDTLPSPEPSSQPTTDIVATQDSDVLFTQDSGSDILVTQHSGIPPMKAAGVATTAATQNSDIPNMQDPDDSFTQLPRVAHAQILDVPNLHDISLAVTGVPHHPPPSISTTRAPEQVLNTTGTTNSRATNSNTIDPLMGPARQTEQVGRGKKVWRGCKGSARAACCYFRAVCCCFRAQRASIIDA